MHDLGGLCEIENKEESLYMLLVVYLISIKTVFESYCRFDQNREVKFKIKSLIVSSLSVFSVKKSDAYCSNVTR